MEVKSYVTLLFTEVGNPYYVFQILAIVLWFLDDYYLYALCIIIISSGSVILQLIETRQVSILLMKSLSFS